MKTYSVDCRFGFDFLRELNDITFSTVRKCVRERERGVYLIVCYWLIGYIDGLNSMLLPSIIYKEGVVVYMVQYGRTNPNQNKPTNKRKLSLQNQCFNFGLMGRVSLIMQTLH